MGAGSSIRNLQSYGSIIDDELTTRHQDPTLLNYGPLRGHRGARLKKPATVTITGAAGQIGYALAFRVASGQMLGTDRPINLQLLEITPALPSLAGVVMELADCAFPTLNRIVATDDAKAAFKDCDYAMLVGARPRGPGMERKELLLANAQIFSGSGPRHQRGREPRRARAGRRQSREHQRAHRRVERARHRAAEFHCDDAARPQPGARAARRQDRQARDTRSAA